MIASLLIVSILIFKGYSNNSSVQHDGQQIDPRDKAKEVNQLIQDAASNRQQAIEKQTQ